MLARDLQAGMMLFEWLRSSTDTAVDEITQAILNDHHESVVHLRRYLMNAETVAEFELSDAEPYPSHELLELLSAASFVRPALRFESSRSESVSNHRLKDHW
jgi:hypothetical protein